MNIKPWSTVAGLSLSLLLTSGALAAPASTSIVISDGVLAMGVGSDAGVDAGGVGVQLVSTGVNGLLQSCACAASLSTGPLPTTESIESLTYTSTTATSSVLVQDPNTGNTLRMVQDFHPVPASPNLYEVLVTVENLGSAIAQPTYTRGVVWTGAGASNQPFAVTLPPIGPSSSQQFRLYFGGGASVLDAAAGFDAVGAQTVSSVAGTTSFVFGYAPGAAPLTAGGGGGGGGGSNTASPSVGNGNPASLGNVNPPSPDTVTPPSNTVTQPSNSTPPSSDGATPPADNLTPPSNSVTPSNDGSPPSKDGSPPSKDGSPPSKDVSPRSNSVTPPSNTVMPAAPSDASVSPPAGSDPWFTADPPGFQPAATPELDSLALLATGLAGIGAYALRAGRARRRSSRR